MMSSEPRVQLCAGTGTRPTADHPHSDPKAMGRPAGHTGGLRGGSDGVYVMGIKSQNHTPSLTSVCWGHHMLFCDSAGTDSLDLILLGAGCE